MRIKRTIDWKKKSSTDRNHREDGKQYKYFNAIAYADYYADVKAVYGYDGEALWAHYDTFGRAEGRQYFAK